MKIKLKDPGSAITHFIALLLVVAGAVPLLLKAAGVSGPVHIVSMTVFVLSMAFLYAASTIYHSLDISESGNRRLRKMDHMMISVLIAGSYTPVCLIALNDTAGFWLCGGVWAAAILGIAVKICWITCPKWFSSVLYISMGWMAVLTLHEIYAALSRPAFIWLLAGGIIYTVGGVIYALKLPLFNARHRNFGSHEVFHLFVMAGSACHFVVMYQYLADMPL